MGNEQSNQASLHINPNFNYFSFSFSGTNTIRLLTISDDIISITEQVIKALWIVDNIKKGNYLVEFVLNGNPLIYKNNEFKFLLCELFRVYLEHGWFIVGNMCLNRYARNGSVVIFNKQEPTNTTQIACLSLDRADRMNFIGTEALANHLREAITKYWSKGIDNEKNKSNRNYTSFEFKVNGYPWHPLTNKDEFAAPEFMCGIFKEFSDIGWTFYSAIQLPDTKTSTLFFKYTEPEAIELNDIFALTLSKSDLIRIINPQPFTIDLVRKVIFGEWLKGVQDQDIKHDAFEFKLRGYPWDNEGEDAINSKRLLNKIIEYLRYNNYNLYSICDISNADKRMSTFFFQRKINQSSLLLSPPSSCRILSLSLNRLNKLRVIDNFSGFNDVLRDAVKQGWPKGISSEKLYYEAQQFKLHGKPFTKSGADSDDAIYFPIFIMCLLDNLKQYDTFRLVGSADLSSQGVLDGGSSLEGLNIHTLFFQYF